MQTQLRETQVEINSGTFFFSEANVLSPAFLLFIYIIFGKKNKIIILDIFY